MVLTNESADPFVEFYDTRYQFDCDENGHVLGQFVTRYNLSTLNGESEYSNGKIGERGGLCLDGGVPEWSLDQQAAQEALTFALGVQ